MLKILGDINLADWYFDIGYGMGTAIKSGINPFSYLNRKNNDFWLGNFECVCADIPNKNHAFVINPNDLNLFQQLNFYGIANNHVMQAGDAAYMQTITYFNQNKILFAGYDKQRAIQFYHEGKKIGIFAFSQRPDNFSKSPLYWHIPELQEIIKDV